MSRKIAKILRPMVFVLALVAAPRARAADQEVGGGASRPVHAFAQAGVGLLEIGHVEAGAFLGTHLTVEAMVASDGVFGARYGGGVFGLLGHAQGRRPPRHALLVGARLMLDRNATFDAAGDNLTSYGVVPVGYGFLANSGFYFRATAGAIVGRERKTSDMALTGAPPVVTHQLGIGGPMITVAGGLAF